MASRFDRKFEMSLGDVLDVCQTYFQGHDYNIFTIPVPMTSASTAKVNRVGVREKILKNDSNLVTEYNPKEAIVEAGRTPISDQDALRGVEQLTSWLVHPSIAVECGVTLEGGEEGSVFTGSLAHWHKDCRRGTIVLIAERKHSESEDSAEQQTMWRPVGGGLVSWRESEVHERQVNAMWCRRYLQKEIEESKFVEFLCITVLANAFQPERAPSAAERGSRILVSVLDLYMRHFPRRAVDFLTTQDDGVCLGSHFETPGDGGNHQSNPKIKCKCAILRKDPSAMRFWGVNETRFLDFCTRRFRPSRSRATIDPTFAMSAASGARDRRSLPPTFQNVRSSAAAGVSNTSAEGDPVEKAPTGRSSSTSSSNASSDAVGSNSPHPAKRRREI